MYIYNHVRTYIPKHNTQNPKICIPKPNIHTQNPKVFWVKRLVCDDKYAIGIHRNSDKVTEYQVRV